MVTAEAEAEANKTVEAITVENFIFNCSSVFGSVDYLSCDDKLKLN